MYIFINENVHGRINKCSWILTFLCCWLSMGKSLSPSPSSRKSQMFSSPDAGVCQQNRNQGNPNKELACEDFSTQIVALQVKIYTVNWGWNRSRLFVGREIVDVHSKLIMTPRVHVCVTSGYQETVALHTRFTHYFIGLLPINICTWRTWFCASLAKYAH